MAKVFLHVYDIVGTQRVGFNRLFKDRIGFGGIFHGAIEVYGVEWAFGWTGVLPCSPTKLKLRSSYAYRECLFLGTTDFSREAVIEIMGRLIKEWPGKSYKFLSRNCCHFCFELAKELGVTEPPVWLNRFANTGEAISNGAKRAAMKVVLPGPRALPSRRLKNKAGAGIILAIAALHRHISARLVRFVEHPETEDPASHSESSAQIKTP